MDVLVEGAEFVQQWWPVGVMVFLLWACWQMGKKPPTRMAILAGALLWPEAAAAQTPTPTPAVKLSSYTWVQYVSSQGKDRAPSFGARLQASARVSRLTLAARLDASAMHEGVSLDNPGTYSSVESYILGAARVAGPVSIAGLWGSTRPTPGESGQERMTWGGGVLVGDGSGEAYVLLMAGRHEVAGDGIRPLIAMQVPLRDRTSVVGDAVLGKGWQVRCGVAVRLR
jgi:hypothetical protein